MALGVALLGQDGSTWDLRTGPIVLLPGAEGFGLPKITRAVVTNPAMDGQRQAYIAQSLADPRSGMLPCFIRPQVSALAWLNLQRAWWSAWSPDKAGTLTVTDPNGGQRTLSVFLESDNGYGLDLDPSEQLLESVPVSWTADQPYWRGVLQSLGLTVPTGGDWLAGGTAPPFQFQTAASTGSGTLSNPGERPAWPTYTISAGATSWSVTMNGQTTSGNFTVPSGYELVVSTAPDRQTALLRNLADGTTQNVTPQLSQVNFTPVPVGASVPVTTTLAGANGATITVAFHPHFRRAF